MPPIREHLIEDVSIVFSIIVYPILLLFGANRVSVFLQKRGMEDLARNSIVSGTVLRSLP